LIKQVALESPPQELPEPKQPSGEKTKPKKVGPFTVIGRSSNRTKYAGSWIPNTQDKDESETEDNSKQDSTSDFRPVSENVAFCWKIIDDPFFSFQSSMRIGDVCISNRCSDCGALIEEYTDEEVGILIIILGTFIHREPTLATPMLPEILTIISRYNRKGLF
jgi:hypothetical protein